MTPRENPFAAARFRGLVGPSVRLVETGGPVARQTRRLLEAAGLLEQEAGGGRIELLATGSLEALAGAARRWGLH